MYKNIGFWNENFKHFFLPLKKLHFLSEQMSAENVSLFWDGSAKAHRACKIYNFASNFPIILAWIIEVYQSS